MSNDDLIATLLDAAEIEGPGTMGNLLRMAAERIEKEHESRLMTLEEINAMNWDYCYAEEEVVKDKHMIELYGEHRIRCITWPSISYYKTVFGSSSYGKRWRCWTQKPTEEQRKAVKWDD